MRSLSARLLTVVLLVLASLTTIGAARAPESEATRIDAPTGATDVVQGEVTAATTIVVGGQVFTRWSFEVTETIEGSASGTITVRTEGGFDGQLVHVVSGQPDLAVGDRVQLWLEPDAGEYLPVGGEDAAVPITPEGLLVADHDDSAENFVLEGFYWADFDSAVPFLINPNTPDLPGTGEVGAITAAFQKWEDDPLSIVDFDYGGATAIKKRTLDGTNAVFWAGAGGQTYLARTTSYFRPNGELVEFDIQFNPYWDWVDGSENGKFDVQSVATHEAGHGLGLGHPSGSGAIMFATLASGLKKRNLSNGDLGGLRTLYGIPACEGQEATLAGTDGNDNLTGTPGNDIIDAGDGDDQIDGGGGDDIICGGDGDDQISGGGGNDRVHGGAGSDNIGGGGGADFLEGNGGNDVIRGGPGNDDLWGLGGNDTVDGDEGNDVARGGPGNDTVRGDQGVDQLTGSSGADKLEGGDGDDKLFGHEGDDTLDGLGGDDKLFGNEGDDVLRGNGGNDAVKGQEGNDKGYGGGGRDLIRGGLDVDRLFGGADDDDIAGGGGADTIVAEGGDDTVNGNAGHDELSGGAGSDQLDGGIGNDTLRGDAGNDTLNGGAHVDWCNGGSGTDTGASCETTIGIP